MGGLFLRNLSHYCSRTRAVWKGCSHKSETCDRSPSDTSPNQTRNLNDPAQEELKQTPNDVFAAAVVFEMALGLLALILGWTLGPDARALIPTLGNETIWPVVSGIGYGCLAAIPIYVFIEMVRKIPCEPVRELERLSDDGMFKTLLQLSAVELILISIAAGVGEELLFRGWLMYFLASPTGEPAGMVEMGAALVASSIAFGLVHPITKLYVVLAAIMGVYFGLLVILTDNLLIPITAHAAYDAAQLIIAGRKPQTAS